MTLRSFIIATTGVVAFAAPATATNTLESVAAFFADAQVIDGPSIVDCTLSGGTKTQCFSITVKAEPTSYTPGPWCPTAVSDTEESGGIWLQDGIVNDVTGAFLENLAAFYGDDNWQLVDAETGLIKVTDSAESCAAAARPDVDPEYQNHCVQCLPEYMGEDATQTYVIPMEPVVADTPNDRIMNGSGLAANGVLMDAAAPVEAILGAYTIAPFDDCGGHVNLHSGYHYHASTGCVADAVPQNDHAPEIGIAMDGFKIVTHLLSDGTAPTDLDICNGHMSDTGEYHYHAGEAGTNAIVNCLAAEFGCHSDDPDAVCDASARRRRP